MRTVVSFVQFEKAWKQTFSILENTNLFPLLPTNSILVGMNIARKLTYIA